jgi:hypothetical protein
MRIEKLGKANPGAGRAPLLRGMSPAELELYGAILLGTPQGTIKVLPSIEGMKVVGTSGSVAGIEGTLRCTSPTLPAAKRGISGQVDGVRLFARRPRFGIRLRQREVHFTVGKAEWRSHTRSFRSYSLVDTGTEEIVARSVGGKQWLSDEIDPSEAVAAVLFIDSGLVHQSSLINWITF